MNRFTFCQTKVCCLIGLTLASCLLGSIAIADNFRIETKVYTGEEEEPISEAITLFQDGVVYDFLAPSSQIAVFRKPGKDRPGRFILLDPERKLHTELSTASIEGALEKLQKWASRQRDPVLRFAANPQFEESFSEDTGELKLVSYQQTYRVETTPVTKPSAMAEYREFLDWYTRLGALHSSMPPQPRLKVNAALARHAVVPVSVELERAGVDEPIRAQHDFTWRLSQNDRARIDEVRDAISSYQLVDNAAFLSRVSSKVSRSDRMAKEK